MSRETALHRVTPSSDVAAVTAAALAPIQRARLIDALRDRADLRCVENFRQLLAELRTSTAVIDAVVIGERDSDGMDARRVVREVAQERRQTAIIVYVRPGSDHAADIRSLAAAGVHQFVFQGIDDGMASLRAIVGAARRQCAAEWVSQQLSPLIPPALHPMIEMILARPDAITTVSGLADAMGVQRNTIFNWCRRAGFMAPEEALVWARLALVGYYLQTTGCTIERIALELSFPSDTSLRNTIKRYTGMRATELRVAGGLPRVLETLKARLAQGPSTRDRLHVE